MVATRNVGRLKEREFQILMARCNVTPAGQALIRSVREGDPVSAPRADRERGNVTGLYPSTLMHVGVQIASVIPELALFMELDNRAKHPDLLEYWRRPTTIHNVVVLKADGSRATKTVRSPRVLCLQRDRVYFLDVIADEQMLESEAKGHNLYKQLPNGSWISPAVAEALVPFGIGYEVWPCSRFGKRYAANLSYLSSAFRPGAEPPDPVKVKDLVSRVVAEGVVYRRQLVAENVDPDLIKFALAHQLVFFPLADEDLTSVEMCRLYGDEATYLHHRDQRQADGAGPPLSIHTVLPKTGQNISWNGEDWLVANAGTSFTITHKNGTFQELDRVHVQRLCDAQTWKFAVEPETTLVNLSPQRLAEAAEKLEILGMPVGQRFWKSGPRQGKEVSIATFNRMKALVAKAEAAGTSKLLALANGYDNCGGQQRHDSEEMAVWRESLDEDYKQNHRPHYASCYGRYLNRCRAANIVPVSETTARKRLALEDKAVIVEARSGNFMAYEYGHFVPRDKVNRLVKGRIPWEVAHVDHAKIEVVVRSCITGELLNREMWRTVLRDACSFRVIALVVFFGPPSYVALYRLILDCVRRWGQLPQYIVSDRGLDFLARQFEAALADVGVCKLNRPAKKPRAGQVAESGNRKDDNNIISNLPGNKLNIENFRKLCEGFRPEDNEVLSLGTIRVLLERVYFEVEPKHITSRTNGETLEDFEARLLREAGTSHIPKVQYTNQLRLRCMPMVDGRSGNRIVTKQGSIECHNLEYFSPVLLQPNMEGKSVRVHYDPDNVAHVFIWLKHDGGWVECFCNQYEVLSQFTPVELDEYTAYLTEKGAAGKVAKRRNRAMAYAEVLSEAKSSTVLVHMHEAARENAHGLPGFTLINGTPTVDLPGGPEWWEQSEDNDTAEEVAEEASEVQDEDDDIPVYS
ncbi:integrase catalytic region [Caballeronia novacaledonica]|uniref:Integrase catalytic region n=1 Tax=Caballeronia novacaledonica TaxID=1544861 RepID=A0A2U3IC89_9BURK|nr:Mu transposase C-terminal domain-containing protein [Caballeronia novacaledonica]SPB17811.1 integrase catalytic region [Caballeronia novacaledonica]